jgi:hypothetical protein
VKSVDLRPAAYGELPRGSYTDTEGASEDRRFERHRRILGASVAR